MLHLALETMLQMLQEGQKMMEQGLLTNPYLLALENEGGVKSIENLQHNPSEEVYEYVDKIIKGYFENDGEKGDDEDECEDRV